MENSISTATAAPIEYDLFGETIELHPLRFTDWGKIEQWMRTQIINAATEAMSDSDLSINHKILLIRAAQQEASRISLSSCFFGGREVIEKLKNKEEIETADLPQPMAFLETFEGMLRCIHLSLRDKAGKDGKPLYTLAAVGEMLKEDFETLATLYEVVFKVSFPEEDEPTEEEPKNEETAEQPETTT